MTKFSPENVVLLLGAGASIEWVKDDQISTNKLTEFILKLLKSEDWINLLTENSKKDIAIVRECNDIIVKILYDAQKGYIEFNFETIVALVDIIGTISQTSNESYYYSNFVRFIYDVEGNSILERPHFRTILKIYPLLLRYKLIQHLYRLCNKDNESKLKNELNEKTKSFLKQLGSSVSIISLNYDIFFQEIVEKLGYSNGFVENGIPDFEIQKLLKASKRIIYPHGSICLRNSIKENPNVFDLKWEKEQLSDERISVMINGFLQHGEQGEKVDGLNFSQSIISGISKNEVVSVSPFSDYYHTAVRSLTEPNSLLIIIGYSFSDDHFNTLINNFLRMKGNRILIIDKFPGNPEENQELDIWLNKLNVYKKLICNHLSMPPDYEYLNDSIIYITYLNRIVCFGGGYYKFLKNREEIFRRWKNAAISPSF